MNALKKFLLFNKKTEKNNVLDNGEVDQYREIGKLVNEARIQQNLTIKELSRISKIPEQTINSIENINKKFRPKYPFIRSILIKLEKCLRLKNNTLVKLAVREKKSITKNKNKKINKNISKKDPNSPLAVLEKLL